MNIQNKISNTYICRAREIDRTFALHAAKLGLILRPNMTLEITKVIIPKYT